MSKNNFNKKKNPFKSKDISLSESDSESHSEISSNPLQQNIFGQDGLLPNDSSFDFLYSKQNSTSSKSEKRTNHIDKRFLCQEDDIKDDFIALSPIPQLQEEMLGKRCIQAIQDLDEQFEEEEEKEEKEEKKEKPKMLGRKRKNKKDLDLNSSSEK